MIMMMMMMIMMMMIIIIIITKIYEYTNNNWSHWNSNEKLKEKFGSHTKNIIKQIHNRQLHLERHT
jgi:uncharacterized membrane protein